MPRSVPSRMTNPARCQSTLAASQCIAAIPAPKMMAASTAATTRLTMISETVGVPLAMRGKLLLGRFSQHKSRRVVIKVRPVPWSYREHKRCEAMWGLCGGKARRCRQVDERPGAALDHPCHLVRKTRRIARIDRDAEPVLAGQAAD